MKGFNIYLRKDGRWEGRITKGKDSNGKRSYHYFFAHTCDQVAKPIEPRSMQYRFRTILKNAGLVLQTVIVLFLMSISRHCKAQSSPIRSPVYRKIAMPSVTKSRFEFKYADSLRCSFFVRTRTSFRCRLGIIILSRTLRTAYSRQA